MRKETHIHTDTYTHLAQLYLKIKRTCYTHNVLFANEQKIGRRLAVRSSREQKIR